MPSLGFIIGSPLGGTPATIGLSAATGSTDGGLAGKGRASQGIAAAIALLSLDVAYQIRAHASSPAALGILEAQGFALHGRATVGTPAAAASIIPASLSESARALSAIAAAIGLTELSMGGIGRAAIDSGFAVSSFGAFPVNPTGRSAQGISVEHTPVASDLTAEGMSSVSVSSVIATVVSAAAIGRGRSSIGNEGTTSTLLAALAPLEVTGRSSTPADPVEAISSENVAVKTRVKILITAAASIWPMSMMQGMGRADEPLDTVELVSDVGLLDRNTGRASQVLNATEFTSVFSLGPKVATVRQIQAALGSIGANHLTPSGRATQDVSITGTSTLSFGVHAATRQGLSAPISPFQNAGVLPRVRTERNSGSVSATAVAGVLNSHGKASQKVSATTVSELSLGLSIRSHTSLVPSTLRSVAHAEARGKSNVGVEAEIGSVASELAFQIRAHSKLQAARGTTALDAAVQICATTNLPFATGLSSLSLRPKGKSLESLPGVLATIFGNVTPRSRVSQGTAAAATTGVNKLGLKSRVRVMPDAIEASAIADIAAKVATVRKADAVVASTTPAAMVGGGRAKAVGRGCSVSSNAEELLVFAGTDPRLITKDTFTVESGFSTVGFIDGVPISKVITFRESATSNSMYAVVGVPTANISKLAPEGYREISGTAAPFTRVGIYKIGPEYPTPAFVITVNADRYGIWKAVIWV